MFSVIDMVHPAADVGGEGGAGREGPVEGGVGGLAWDLEEAHMVQIH